LTAPRESTAGELAAFPIIGDEVRRMREMSTVSTLQRAHARTTLVARFSRRMPIFCKPRRSDERR
jgi:hypothetical protein